VLAAVGYVSEQTFARGGTGGLRLLAPLAKDPGRHRARTPERALHPDKLPATAAARRRMQHPRAPRGFARQADLCKLSDCRGADAICADDKASEHARRGSMSGR
jgi:hypothetical protein